MSLFAPFRNVTVVAGFGRRAVAEPVRSAAPDRRPSLWPSVRHPWFYRAGVSSLGS
jgi:hypothetical protein